MKELSALKSELDTIMCLQIEALNSSVSIGEAKYLSKQADEIRDQILSVVLVNDINKPSNRVAHYFAWAAMALALWVMALLKRVTY